MAPLEYQPSPEFDWRANWEVQWLCGTLQDAQIQAKIVQKCVNRYQQRL